MKTDAQLKMDVEAELKWDPAVNATNVGVAVKDRVVTLTGHLDTYAEKFAIERAVQRVKGVQAVAIELDVKLAPGHVRSDSEIARAIESSFKWHALIPADRIQVKVEQGWVTLSGELDWEFQRRQAEGSVRNLTGVVGVSNKMTIKVTATPEDITQRIRDALTRQAVREAHHVQVSVSGRTVTLKGKVHSWPEKSAAQGAAWSAPGITSVINHLEVDA